MTDLLGGVLASAAWGLFTEWRFRRALNPVLLRCSACGSKLTFRPTSRWGWIGLYEAWWVTAWVVVWRLDEQFWPGFLWVLLLVVPFNIAERRVRVAIWRWRHPLRCGGGEPEPVPSRS